MDICMIKYIPREDIIVWVIFSIKILTKFRPKSILKCDTNYIFYLQFFAMLALG